MTPETETRSTVEHVGAPFGFVLHWSVSDHWADVTAYKVVSFEGEKAFFEVKDDCSEHTDDTTKAEVYLKGFIKWDGCAELDQGCPHWCGAGDFKMHFALLKHIYLRASVLMGRGEDGLDTPWNSTIGESPIDQ